MPELAIIVPTRGRPENIRKVISAWDFTNAWDVADLVLAVDADDSEISRYHELAREHEHPDTGEDLFRVIEYTTWLPMVHKLNATATRLAEEGRYFALGFAGDDHLPQTIGWAARYLTVLHEMGSGMVYGDDGYQGIKLSTEWAMTADVVRALGRMVPAPVEHMYCDNSMMDLFNGAHALRHLPEVRIEHFNPYAGGKGQMDAQYKRVNGRDQYRRDRLAYERWRRNEMAADVATVRALRPDALGYQVAATKPERPAPPPRPRGQIRRSGPTRERIDMSRFPFSREFKHVRGATPDEIGMTLADFATGVPADQEIVELGVFQGRTALIMAWGAAQGNGAHVTAIDPWDTEGNVYDPPFTDAQSRVWAEYRVRELGYSDRISLVQAFSADVAEEWVTSPDLIGRGGKLVGLLFVDGDHTKEGARRDIEAWAVHLAPGATIAVDDYHHPDWPGVAEAVDELVAEGVLAPVEVYHDRLAVTHLTVRQEWATTGHAATPINAITSEGVSPTPVVASHTEGVLVREVEEVHLPEGPVETEPGCSHPDCTLEHPHAGPAILRSDLEAEWRRVDPEGVAALEASAEALTRNGQVQAEEVEVVQAETGTPIEELTIPQMKALAKHRGIVLGARKDKRDLILRALREGK
jgi:predicted O-methyltransferase YrrM